MSESITFGGKASVAHGGDRKHNPDARFAKGDRIVAVVEADVRAFEDKRTAHSGDEVVMKLRIGEVTILTGDEEARYKEMLADQRAARIDGAGEGQTKLGDGVEPPSTPPADEYEGLSKPKLKELALERGLATTGSAKDLQQRLRDND